jgi:hypothetical protein
MSNRPLFVAEKKKEAPPARPRDTAPEPVITDESIPADNRYAPASGMLTPPHNPMPGAQ